MFNNTQVQSPAIFKKSNGAALVGRGVSNVDADLTATENTANSASLNAIAAIAAGDTQHLSVVDMHYGALRGLGWTSAENGSTRSYTLNIAASQGDMSITLSANASIEFGDAPLVDNQLIVYLGDDGFYYSVGISGVAGAVMSLKSPLKSDVSTGATIFNFYANESHPNQYGYRAIVDYAASELLYAGKEVSRQIVSAYGSPSINTNGANDKNSPGSSTVVNKNVVTNTGGYTEGVSVTFVPKSSGAHIARMKMNTLNHDVRVSWAVGGFSDSLVINNNSPELIEFPFFVYSDTRTITFYISGNVATEAYLINEVIEFIKVDSSKPSFNRGKHVLLGDSWFEQMGVVGSGDLWFEDRFPNATFVNSGVGGNTATQLTGRFDSDVAAHKPDYVWIMVGTNDYYASVSADSFSYYLNKLKMQCAAIGAHAIFFTPSVGSADESAARFDLSRRYTQNAYYFDRELNDGATQRQVITFPDTTIPNGSEVCLANLGRFANTELTVYEYYFTHDIIVREKTTIGSGGTNIGTLTGNTLTTSDTSISHTAGRFLQLSHNNTSGSDVVVSGYAIVNNEAEY